MNAELLELIRLFEAMHACFGNETERTTATNTYAQAVSASASKNQLTFSDVNRYVKEKYHERARADERRKKLPPPPH